MLLLSKNGHARPARRRRSSRILPHPPEDLEARDLPAAGPLGINLTSLEYVDVFKDPAGAWSPTGQSPLRLDSHGWPTADAFIGLMDLRVNQPWNGPDPNANSPDIGGTYHLSFHGRATVSPPGWLRIFTVQNQAYDAATNVTTADVVVGHNVMPFLMVYFTNTANRESPTGAGVSDVQMLRPGYEPGTTQIFTNEYVNALKPFDTLRSMDAVEANNYGPTTNNSGPLDWSRRRLPSEASQSDDSNGHRGQAWEYLVALANETHTNMWITIPGPATDDYVARLADLIKNGSTVDGVHYAGLDAGLKVYVEYSNEVWGGIYNPYAYNLQAAEAEVAAGTTKVNNDGSRDHILWAFRRYLERTKEVGDIFRAEYGGDPGYDTIRPVLGWQELNWQYYTNTFPWFQATYGAPSLSFYGLGNAIYWRPTDTSTAETIITSLASAEANVVSAMSAATAVAMYYGMENVSYEGGPVLVGADPAMAAKVLAASRDPRMQALVRQHYLDWFAAGGSVANFYDGPYAIWAPRYGLFPAAELSQRDDPSLSPKYRGLQDIASADPVAPTAGTAISAASPTSLSVAADSLGRAFTNPKTNQDNYWLLNVSAAGNYDLRVTTGVNPDFAAKYVSGQVEVRLENQASAGVYDVAQAGTFSLGSVSLHAGLNVLVIHTVHGSIDPSHPFGYHFQFQPTALTLLPTARSAAIGSPITTETGTWAHLGPEDVAAPGNGNATATWTFPVIPGVYRISASWGAAADRSSSVPYSIFDGGVNLRSTVTVDQQQPPTGYFADSATWQVLGSTVTVLGVNLKVQIANAPDGTASARAIRIERLLPITSPEVINDNNETEFATTGSWRHVGDNSSIPGASGVIAQPGNGNATATWTFTVTPGLYKVSTTWPGGSNYSSQAPYTILDGTRTLATVPVNQKVASTGYVFIANWEDLGGPYRITGNKLVVRLTSVLSGAVQGQAVRIQRLPESTPTSGPALSDLDFETPALSTGHFAARPASSPWTFRGSAGVSANDSGFTFGNPDAPRGSQVAFLTMRSSISQALAGWAAGAYTITFQAARRGNWGAANDFQVLVDGVAVGTFLPNSVNYEMFSTSSFTVAAGTHTVTFQGLNTSGYIATALIDGISILYQPTAPQVVDSGFEGILVGPGNSVAPPAGSAWTFAGDAGVTTNDSAITSSNPPAPEGSKVAYLKSGTISQNLIGWAAGRYTIAFQAAKLNLPGNAYDFQVLVDGVVVGSFRPTSTSYQALVTSTFTVTGGNHTITFRGTSPGNSGRAVLIDAVSVTRQA